MMEEKSKPTSTDSSHPGSKHCKRIVQNYRLVWLDTNAAASNEDSQHILEQLRSVVNDVTMFSHPEECTTFLQGIQLEKVFLIASGSLARSLVPCIHAMTQVDTIYIFCGDKSQHEEWAKEWPKVKGIFIQIEHIFKSLELAAKQCDQDCVGVSFTPISTDDASKINLNQLEPSFMYTQLFKNTLLTMEHNCERAVRNLVNYCKKAYDDNNAQLVLVNKFGRDYRPEQAIWWYTREGFIYPMLNRALRLLEADIIVNMGFFIHDLHEQIQRLHQEQVGYYGGRSFLVYRGQGLSTTDFEKLNKSQGGLMSFNCFLSTSRHRCVPAILAESSAIGKDKVGILFLMMIDSNNSSPPFANIESFSSFETEAEILFSMHTVFRIDSVKPRDGERAYFEVSLSLTNDDDTLLRSLTVQLDDDTQSSHGWERMGQLLIQVGQRDKAEELYHTLFKQTSDVSDQTRYYHQLGYIKQQQGDYKQALFIYERALEIRQTNLPANHPDLATSYNNIGSVYKSMGEYSNALSFYERALEILQQNLPANHPDLGTPYNNIGSVYESMGKYSKALSFYEKDLAILQKSLPANHPDLATSYNNIGSVYDNTGDYLKALSFYERALEITRKSIPANHPDLATFYDNIGSVYNSMHDYPKALSFYEKDLAILQKSLPANHPDLATPYNNIGSVYHSMGEYSKAISSLERALKIWQKTLPVNHPNLKTVLESIQMVKLKLNKNK